MRRIAIFAALVLIPASASADEPAVHLKHAPGVDVVEGHCGACHSLDYIVMNSPFLDAAHWDAEVAKMSRRLARRSARRMPRPSAMISK